jgi:hypothetical protein
VILDQQPACAGESSCPIGGEQSLDVVAVLDDIDHRIVYHVYTETGGYSLGGSVQLRCFGCIPLQRLDGRS